MEFQLFAFRTFLRVDRKKHAICFLRVLAAQELLAPLLAHALFLGCTVYVDRTLTLLEKLTSQYERTLFCTVHVPSTGMVIL